MFSPYHTCLKVEKKNPLYCLFIRLKLQDSVANSSNKDAADLCLHYLHWSVRPDTRVLDKILIISHAG